MAFINLTGHLVTMQLRNLQLATEVSLTLSPRDLHLFKGNFDPLLHMFPKVLGS